MYCILQYAYFRMSSLKRNMCIVPVSNGVGVSYECSLANMGFSVGSRLCSCICMLCIFLQQAVWSDWLDNHNIQMTSSDLASRCVQTDRPSGDWTKHGVDRDKNRDRHTQTNTKAKTNKTKNRVKRWTWLHQSKGWYFSSHTCR